MNERIDTLNEVVIKIQTEHLNDMNTNYQRNTALDHRIEVLENKILQK